MLFRISTILLLVFVSSTFIKASTIASKENEQFNIQSIDQKLEFFLNKKKELNARLKVKLVVHSNSSLEITFTRAVFFDNDSEVEINKLRYNGMNKLATFSRKLEAAYQFTQQKVVMKKS